MNKHWVYSVSRDLKSLQFSFKFMLICQITITSLHMRYIQENKLCLSGMCIIYKEKRQRRTKEMYPSFVTENWSSHFEPHFHCWNSKCNALLHHETISTPLLFLQEICTKAQDNLCLFAEIFGKKRVKSENVFYMTQKVLILSHDFFCP